MPRKSTSTDAIRNALTPQPSTVDHLTQETANAAQGETKKRRGRQPKEQETQRATFIVSPPELWESFKLYAEILGDGTTATDLLLAYINKTVTENADAITAYREAKERARMAAKAALPDQQTEQ